MTVVHLPLSQAAPWPDEDKYRPPGWRTHRSPREIAELDGLLTADDKDRTLTATQRDTLNALSLQDIAEVRAHAAILRQSWVTRPGVWRLAERLVGPPQVDPFWNPWSHVHRLWAGVRLLDGNDGRDGFDVSLWGRVDDRQPRTGYVNGPHGDTAAYVETCAAAHLAGHRVAAIVALDGLRWFAGQTMGAVVDEDQHVRLCADVLSCDVLAIPEDGRMSFVAPPGVKASSPSKGYALACWGVPVELMEQIFGSNWERSVRVEAPDRTPWTLLLGRGDAGCTGNVRKRLPEWRSNT